MAGLTYDDLYQVSLSSLGTAAEDWKDMVDQLAKLATDATDGMVRQSDAARWEGVNAGVTRPFIRTTAAEFRDAHAQAKSIWSMLRDAHQDLTAVQKALRKAVDVDAKKHSIQVSGGAGSTVICQYVDRSGEKTKLKPEQVEYLKALEEQINHLLVQANEIDDSVSRALGRIHGGDSHNFGHAKYDTLDDAQRERTVQLAKKSLSLHEKGEELSTKELAEFRTLLQGSAKDPEFAVEFYREMGAKDALRFQAQLSIDASSGDDKTRLELAQSIQKDMGLALATATDPPTGKDNPHTSFREDRTYLGKAWINDLKKVGTQPLNVGLDHAQPVGYQALASLLRNGDYDKSFLNPIAQDMVTLERKGGSWPVPDPHKGDQHFGLNLADKKSPGWDPMTGLLEAFGHSPEASTAFFNGSTGGGNSDLKRLTNLDFFLSEDKGREWLPDKTSGLTDPDDESRVPAKQALGHALESATTGRPYGDEGSPRPHTREQADLFEKVVVELGDNSGVIKHDGSLAALAPSLGNMSAEYMYDIQRAFAGGETTNYFDHAGADVDSSKIGAERRLASFLQAIAEDPEAYSTVTHSQQAVTTDVIHKIATNSTGEDLRDDIGFAAQPAGTIAGVTSVGRSDAIAAADDSVQKVREYNEKLDEGAKWAGRFAEMGANHIPVYGDVVSWLYEDAQEAVLEHYKDSEEEAAQKIEEDRERYVDNQREKAAKAIEKTVQEAAEREGISIRPDSPGAKAIAEAYGVFNLGYSDGRTR
ncbi:hypothetical protein H8N00_26650 [Streptomyces sp. AC563]|uniref:hypothetical protein n=1 Tax=Streptomyces buecherae TaxID=2763006 RepID=UPI00164D4511|nr:hypothetical protein [Streptomyces buecherae]MBC3992392.1 hypothetical protein [Streptomyces buecherae]